MPVLSIVSLLWGNPLTRMISIVSIAFLAGWWMGFRAVKQVDVAAVVKNAQDGRDGEWTRKLSQAKEDHERELAEAIAAADTVPALAPDADLVRLCKQSPDCRDKDRQYR